MKFLVRRVVLAIGVLLMVSFVSFCFFASTYLPLKGTPLLPAYWRWLRGVPTGHNLGMASLDHSGRWSYRPWRTRWCYSR